MLDWIFEAIIDWVARTVTSVMDAVSGIFLNALGTDMLAMEEYFPFVTRAFTIMQYTAWALLFIILVWQLFKTFGGPITEAEEPWGLVLRSSLFAILIYFAKPIFLYVLDIARAPYTALMDVAMTGEDFSFAGVEAVLKNGLVQYVSNMSVVGAILQIILIIALGWNYFKLLLEVVERYIVVWQLVGASSNKMAAEFCLTIFKTIRGFGGAAVAATQDLSDFFGLDDGRYGRAIINNSQNKIVLNLEYCSA